MRSISTDYSQNQPKSATKDGEKNHIFFLSLSVRVGAWCPLTFDLVSHQQRERFLCADLGKTIVLTTQSSQIAIFFRTFSMVFNCHSLFNEAAHLAAPRWLHSPFAIRDTNSKQSKTKIYEKNYLLLGISAVIGTYGLHLMNVMIFVTQNNF